jgi:ligand-binding sensor domain-containing protein
MVFEYKSGGSSGPWSPPGSVAATAATIALFFDPRTAGVVYLGGAGGVYRSTDGAASSTKESLGDSTTIARSFIAQPATAQGVYVGTSKGLFQSADGITWSSGSADLAARLVFALAPDASSASTLWAGTDDGVYRSTDAGAHWAKAGTGVGGNVHAVLSTAGRLIAGADAGLFTSVDGGATWVAAAGVPATVNALVQNPSDGALFAGSLAGVFESTDGGASWASESEGLTNPNVICFGLLGDGTFLAGTNGGSAFALVRTAARGPVSRATESPVPRVLGPRP